MPAARTVFKSAADRDAYLADYDRRLAALPLAVESRWVDTRHARTHLLLSGPADAPPLAVLHGGNGSALDLAAAWAPLADHHRVAWLDVPGEPNRSDPTTLDKGSAMPAEWLADVFDALQWPRAALAAMSGGGAHALRVAAHAPDRITRLALVVPQGLALNGIWPLVRHVVWPLWRARRRPTDANVRRLYRALYPGGEPPSEAITQMQRVLRHATGADPAAPLITSAELAAFHAPALVIAGGRDVLFPGEPLLARAREAFPGPLEAIFVPDAGHLDPRWFSGESFDRLRAFLRAS